MARPRMTTADFIEKSRAKHGDKYDYSLAEYITAQDKVKIICPDHGVFEQIAHAHYHRSGCPDCATESRTGDADSFALKARAIHGSRYDYGSVAYKGAWRKVKIRCMIHGYFYQTPNIHLRGRGCQTCARHGTRGTTERFLADAKRVHGDTYDYSKAVYETSRTKVVIICKKHGAFELTPNHHIGQGQGCRACAGNEPLTTQTFIDKAKKVHGSKYDYSTTTYFGSQEKVKITCPAHGDFFQTASTHLCGHGCNLCPRRHDHPCLVYVLKGKSGVSKVGITIEPKRRYHIINRESPFQVTPYKSLVCQTYLAALKVEQAIHRDIAALNCGYTGFDGATEWFNIEPAEAIALVKRKAAEMDALA